MHRHELNEGRADRIGIVASALCGVHCLLGAILAGASSFGVFLREGWLEALLLSTALIVAVWALYRGHAQHRQRVPLFLFAAAMPAIVAARLLYFIGTWPEAIFSVIGAVLLISAHVANLRALARCRHSHCAH